MTEDSEKMDNGYTVLIMAANRHGINNRVAKMAGTSHKCVVPVAGVAMIERVIRTVEEWGRARRILVSIENPSVLDTVPYVTEAREAGRVVVTQSGETLTASVFEAARDLADSDYPLLITTGDNVLHTAEILGAFASAAEASEGDVILGLTPRTVVEQSYPEDAPNVGYLKFAEGEYSNCNFYILKNAAVLPIAQTMQQGGQFRHYPLRILKVFGIVGMIKYQLGRARIEDIRKRVQRAFKVKLDPVILPFAEAPIDVDTVVTHGLAERILRAREAGEGRAAGGS